MRRRRALLQFRITSLLLWTGVLALVLATARLNPAVLYLIGLIGIGQAYIWLLWWAGTRQSLFSLPRNMLIWSVLSAILVLIHNYYRNR